MLLILIASGCFVNENMYDKIKWQYEIIVYEWKQSIYGREETKLWKADR